jgi:hypothetical protein
MKVAYEGYQDHGVLTYTILEVLNRDESAKRCSTHFSMGQGLCA